MRLWTIRALPLILFFIFGFKLPYAQLMGIRHFKIEQGSSQVKYFTLYKNHQGYIYVGTSEGLYKFDGIKFTALPFQNIVSSTSVTSIFEDNTRQLWVGFQNGDIARVENGKINFFYPEEGTPKKRITCSIQDKQNNLWFGTDGEGVYYTHDHHLYNINVNDGLAENNVYTLALADNGDVLAGSDQGISICKISGTEKKVININSKSGLPDNFVKLIVPAGGNNFWIGMQDKGICLFNKNKNTFISPPSFPEPAYQDINDMLLVNDGLWISTEKGLLKLTGLQQPVYPIKAGVNENLKISKMLQDNQGNIWMINNTNELLKTAGEQLKLKVSYDQNDFEKVHAILCDNKNNIWYGDKSGIVRSLSNPEERKEKFNIKELDIKTDITALFQDANNFIWIGTMGKGIFLLDPETGNYRHINENKLLDKGSVLSISGKGNDVFITSLEGAAAFHPEADAQLNSKLPFYNFNNISSIGSNYIYSIFKDSKERVWFATDGKGITVFKNGSFTNYNEASGIKDKVVYSITEDYNGNIWFSTHSAGIYKFDGKKFTNFSTADGLSDINISAIKTDERGNIIIIHEKGIDLLNPVTGEIYYINDAQGINEINAQDLGTVTKDTAEGVLVSTSDGILCYHSVPNMIYQPQTILENVQLFFNTTEKPSGSNFNHNENNFTFLFTALYYSDPQALQYQYKLDGYNIRWITTKDKSITFPQLPPGKYTFHVRSSINRSFSFSTEAAYQFFILKPFWATWWFIIACLLVAGILLYWYINSRERHLKKLERLNQEKIQFQFETLRNQVNPHFLFNSFNTLIAVIEENPKMAVEYVEQLSDFFRNIVNYRDKEIIALEEEIKLLQTYFFIQQKRYRDSLQLNIQLSAQQRSGTFIPPLTLQLLAENAIKHNAVSKETPLYIKIFMKDECLLVCNNINEKITAATGAGMGLQNIINRYNLLTKNKIQINSDKKNFIVSLPALTKSYD